MAVAPANKVRQVLEYAVTQIPPYKINMGIPNYGYDWKLPFEKGVSRAKLIGCEEAIEIAQRYGAEIQYDDLAESPFFHYTSETGEEHEVWFEDARSIMAKFELVAEFKFRGVGYWNLMRSFVTNWMIAAIKFDINKIV